MNWDAVGAIGEIIGAVAVIVTLIYLAVQIGDGARASRSAAVTAKLNQVYGTEGAELSPDIAKAQFDSLNHETW